MRTRVQNALQAIALANGMRRGPSLWSRDGQHTIASLPLAPHTAHRRSELQAMYVKFESDIERLNKRVEEQAGERPGARLLMTHPGVGPVTALATEVFLGDPKRFTDGKALASYVGIIPENTPAEVDRSSAGSANKGIRCCDFSGVRREPTRHAGIRSCSDLSSQDGPERFGESENGCGSQARDSALDHVAERDEL